jgi:branched-chain amino acid transport system substrate-binding protein
MEVAMKKTACVTCFLFLLAGILMVASYPLTAQSAEPVKIGAILDITGHTTFIAPMLETGIKFRFDEAGWKAGGRPLELIIEDGASNLELTNSLAHKLVEKDKVNIMIGPLNHGFMIALEPYLAKNKVCEIDVTHMAPEIEAKDEWFFAPPGVAAQCGYYTGQYASELGYKTATILGADYVTGYQWTGAFAQGFEKNGGKVIGHAGWAPIGTVDYGPYLGSLKKADVFVAWTVPASTLVKQYYEFGLWKRMPFMLIYTNTVLDADLAELGKAGVGLVGSALYAPEINTTENHKFVAAFQKKYNRDPCEWDVVGYDAASVAVAALDSVNGDTTPEKLRDAIQKVKITLPTGPFSFSSSRYGIRPIYILKSGMVKDKAQWQIIREYPASTEALPIPPSSKKGAEALFLK